jgi:hypothetical protein
MGQFDNPVATYAVDGPAEYFREIEQLVGWLNQLAQHAKDAEDTPLPEMPEGRWESGFQRGVRSTGTVVLAPESDNVSIAEAQSIIRQAMRRYIVLDQSNKLLLVKAKPGIGKTTAAVQLAEELSARGKRVLFCGPRHPFFADIQALSSHPEWWYEWLPRGHKDQNGEYDLCLYPEQIAT